MGEWGIGGSQRLSFGVFSEIMRIMISALCGLPRLQRRNEIFSFYAILFGLFFAVLGVQIDMQIFEELRTSRAWFLCLSRALALELIVVLKK